MSNSNAGRPTVIDHSILQKLWYVFALGGTDEEACLHAGISVRTLYYYQENNEEFLHEKELIKNTPTLLARQTVVKELRKDPKLAMEYLKRKKKDEFSDRTEQYVYQKEVLEEDKLNEIDNALSKQQQSSVVETPESYSDFN